MAIVKKISIKKADSTGYDTREIGANAINIDIQYDENGNVITDESTAVSSTKTLAEVFNDEIKNGANPKVHADTTDKYGKGSSTKFGHVKVSDTYKSSIGSAVDGVAASQASLYEVYRLANKTVLDTMEGIKTNTESGKIAGALALKEAIEYGGIWLGSQTIASGSTTKVITDASINATSIIDVYYAEESKSIVQDAVASYAQEAGKLTISFENALEFDATISNVKVVNP